MYTQFLTGPAVSYATKYYTIVIYNFRVVLNVNS